MVGALLAVAKVYSDTYSDYVLSLCVCLCVFYCGRYLKTSLCNNEAHCGQIFETENVLISRDLTYFFSVLTYFKHINHCVSSTGLFRAFLMWISSLDETCWLKLEFPRWFRSSSRGREWPFLCVWLWHSCQGFFLRSLLVYRPHLDSSPDRDNKGFIEIWCNSSKNWTEAAHP